MYRRGGDGVPSFFEAGAPTDDELHALLQCLISRLAGQRDAKALARHRHRCVKASGHDIVRALTGNWREEHLFVLEQALAVYDDLAKRLHENSSRPDPEPRIGRGRLPMTALPPAFRHRHRQVWVGSSQPIPFRRCPTAVIADQAFAGIEFPVE